MSAIKRVVLAVAIVISSATAFADRPEIPGTPRKVLSTVGTTVQLPAPRGTSDAILGLGLTGELKEVDSSGKRFGVVLHDEQVKLASSEDSFSLDDLKTEKDFNMKVGILFLDASTKYSATSEYLILTLFHIDHIVKLNQTSDLPTTSALFAPVEIDCGWAVHYLLESSGTKQAVGGGVGGKGLHSLVEGALGGSADFESVKKQFGIKVRWTSRGLKEKASAATLPFLATPDAIAKYFEPTPEPEPIFVTYEELRNLEAPRCLRNPMCAAPDEEWYQHATAAANAYFAVNGNVIAVGIQRITHPTGANPSKGAVRVSRTPVGLSVEVDSIWTGGLTRSTYATTARWTFGPRGDLGTILSADSARIKVASTNAAQLNTYFKDKIFPAVFQATNR